ncbi:hypothetical protein [Pseudomonas asiatica]|uniref:hypothetical protein n=1 Tax=Pseudomonas asiatica TaxID=2219225 RepID=UPI0010C0564C|nr:hypothetical protein [Pseudomonas asiatica]
MIYLVMFEVESQPSEPVRAFTSEAAAWQFQAQLKEYDDTFDDVDDDPQAEADWKAKHPAGPKYFLPDTWEVVPVPLDDEVSPRHGD